MGSVDWSNIKQLFNTLSIQYVIFISNYFIHFQPCWDIFRAIHRDHDANEFKSPIFYIERSQDRKNMFTQDSQKYLIPDNQQSPTYYIYIY